MRIIIFTAFIFIVLSGCSVKAQKSSALTPNELQLLVGCWQGTLHYSGTLIRKPFTTTTEMTIKPLPDSRQWEQVHRYPQDNNATTSDTFILSADGKKLNNAGIVSKRYNDDKNLELILESSGFDQDNNQAVTVRQTYTIGKERYTYKKEIYSENQKEWLDREDFVYTRKKCE